MSKVIEMRKDMAYELIIKEFSTDIECTIRSFLKKSTMPSHLFEDIYQESLILLFTRLDKYDSELSGMRTFTVRTTEIACLRFRHSYFKLSTSPDFVMEQEGSGEHESIETILENIGVKGRDRDILIDRVEGYTLLEISSRHDISVNRIYELIDEVGVKLNHLK